ncbi:SAFB-like transcription modulator isoform X2 [Anoplophora glabripennis]|uniref:SAFB-like transcription modulator isoform X2 n=1 Tax=Anoplophora glabripennis TaxID=217634 RepID=UPI0008751861|nr:SAFB-like transcription modulator isoform X2 [Anoplophora glabripennis]
MSESENKKLFELRVVDLRAELDKRGLDRNGVKQVLLERLGKALTDEGFDPDTYEFEISDKKRSSTRLSVESMDEEKSDKAEEKNVEKPSQTDKKPEEDEKQETESKSDQSDAAKDNKEANTNGEKVTDAPEEENDGHESPIRLTLEDDDETLHDVENETTTEKSATEKEAEEKSEDKKSNTSEATSQSDSKTSEQSAEKAAGSSGDYKDGDKESADGSSSGTKLEDTKLQKKVGAKSNPNVVWISNVAQNTRASELKAALSSCGKVTGAKVVVNARFPGTCCFGYVTMSSVEDVENVIAKLNNTELNGQIIKIDKFDHVRAEQMKQLKAVATPNKTTQNDEKSASKSPGKDSLKKDDKSVKSDDKSGSDTEKKKEGDNKEEKDDIQKGDSKGRESKEGPGSRHSRDRTRGDSRNGVKSGRSDDGRVRSASGTSRDRRGSRSRDRDRRHIRSNSRGRHERDVLTFDKIREERERQRLREKERLLREEARRRQEEAARQREVERRQRSEAHRLEKEKEKLRMEREKIEREKAELVRMERERQRLEREKIALEKMELERTLMRLGEERRAVKRPAPYRREDGFEERKRSASDRHFEEPPPPPRFDPPPRPGTGPSGSSGKYEGRPYDGRDSRGEPRSEPRSEPRGRELPPSRPKDSRYVDRERERDRSPHFRPSVRDERERRPLPDSKPDLPISSRDHRYGDPNGPGRFDRNSSSWTNPPQKPFNSVVPPKPWAAKDPWRPDSSVSDRSNSGSTANRANDNREPKSRDLPTSRPKDSRYVEREKEHRSPHPRPNIREERDRRTAVENKSVMPISSRDHRYGGSNDSGPGRSDRNSAIWAVPSQKPFPLAGSNKPWRPSSSISERWPSGPQGSSSIRPYPGNPQPNMVPISPVLSGVNRYQDRHDYNKTKVTNPRKY